MKFKGLLRLKFIRLLYSALVTWWPAGFSNRLFGSFPELRGMKPADLGCDRVTAIHKCKWNQPSSRRVLHNRNVNRGWPLDKKTLNISKKIHRSHRSISQADEAASRPWLIQQLRWERHRRSSRKYGSRSRFSQVRKPIFLLFLESVFLKVRDFE